MEDASPIDLAIAVPTLIGSLTSFLASLVVIGLHVAYPPKRHFRHALIINLLIADLINSFNNSASGIAMMGRGITIAPSVPADAPCIANAWIGQFSVQAVDFNILIISIVVCYTVFSRRQAMAPSTLATVLVCASAWVPGLITSNIGLGLHAYGNVSGNWCWIMPSRLDLRYALTHGWRIAIFLATIGIYTAIYIRLKSVFGKFRMAAPSSSTGATGTTMSMGRDLENEPSDTQGILVTSSFAVGHELDSPDKQGPGISGRSPSEGSAGWSLSSLDHGRTDEPARVQTVEAAPATQTSHRDNIPASPNLRKMLLMNGYPIAYILLWIPGMANRLTESIMGASPRWLTILQSTTQFVGLANALTYGLSEQMRRRIRRKNMSRHKFTRTEG